MREIGVGQFFIVFHCISGDEWMPNVENNEFYNKNDNVNIDTKIIVYYYTAAALQSIDGDDRLLYGMHGKCTSQLYLADRCG